MGVVRLALKILHSFGNRRRATAYTFLRFIVSITRRSERLDILRGTFSR